VQTWGEKQTIDIKSDWALLTEEERRRKADELIAMIQELREPPMQPPPLVYRPEEAPDEPDPGGSVANLDDEPLGRAEGARLCCGDFDHRSCGESARSRGCRRQPVSGEKVPKIPRPLFRSESGIWVPFTSVTPQDDHARGVKERQDDGMTVNVGLLNRRSSDRSYGWARRRSHSFSERPLTTR
jgi:hypothetical protein